MTHEQAQAILHFHGLTQARPRRAPEPVGSRLRGSSGLKGSRLISVRRYRASVFGLDRTPTDIYKAVIYTILDAARSHSYVQ